jgi:bifunctional UDP-N-acetylglucosamine pyrophosphorylase / glucosamine-1-phosphate N-acetyltransferase
MAVDRVELKPKCHDKIIRLIDKGVKIPNPLTLDIGEEVEIDHISGSGVKIYPGCRIYGEKTVISAGAHLGYEGPVTIEDCQIGPKVKLKGGYFNRAVFLEKASMGLGAHVREGCIVEEQASGAHCVGLKQTILFPFVTLGSLINFCDCLMAGGTSRKNHSEVGSSYIHFNFTPDGDKTTASLIGDVPRGVMLNQPPIFLGGQGGLVGPVRLGYGNIVAAGSILRQDVYAENKLIIGKSHPGAVINISPMTYVSISRIVENNIIYLANLVALEEWYIHVRQSFFKGQEFGDLIYAGVLDKLNLAKNERIKRLEDMASKISVSSEKGGSKRQAEAGRREFHDKVHLIRELFVRDIAGNPNIEHRNRFLKALDEQKRDKGLNYIETIQSLPDETSQEGVQWLDQIVGDYCQKAGAILPSLNMFKRIS